jgi:hypothetical protein
LVEKIDTQDCGCAIPQPEFGGSVPERGS